MNRNVQIVLLCEDAQHESFGRRFLEKVGWTIRHIRVERAPKGLGSAEQFVRKRFPDELEAYRRRKHRVSVALIVMVDGDNHGVDQRVDELDTACRERQQFPLSEKNAMQSVSWKFSFRKLRLEEMT